MLKRVIAAASLLGAMALCVRQAHAQIGKVIVWGVDSDTPEWNRALGVSGARQGCSSAPSACIHIAKEIAHKDHVKVFLSILLTPDSPGRAVEYSQLSSSVPALVEVGTDDFVSAWKKLAATAGDPEPIVDQVINNLKSINPNLKWGVTLYEDELSNPVLQDASLPAAVKAKFDYIHLYAHYRRNGLNYDKYIPQVRKLFPNARIIAGAYAYDRRQYLPCAQKAHEPCSSEEELDLFQKTIAIQSRLFKEGTVDWIEFYPGYFGREGEWNGLDNPRYCKPGDREACVQNTKQLHAAAIRELGGEAPSR